MKIRNISKKVIGIGGNVVMPDEEIVVDELAGNAPAVDALVKQGYLVIMEAAPVVEKKQTRRRRAAAEAEEVAAEETKTAEAEE